MRGSGSADAEPSDIDHRLYGTRLVDEIDPGARQSAWGAGDRG